MILFHPLTIADKALIEQRVFNTECRNCDLSVANLVSWRFLYDTEVADYNGWLLFRFKADGHLAYLAPVGEGNWRKVLTDMMADAEAQGHPFLMLGVCEHSLALLDAAMPGYFYATADRNFTDYIYNRTQLTTLSGKKMQPKRNFVNRFTRNYPNYCFLPLKPNHFEECLALDTQWTATKSGDEERGRYTYEAERRSLENVFAHWNELEMLGGVLCVDNRIVAFTYGCPINRDTFDVCFEKADTSYEGAFATINRDFVRSLPPQYELINREEDLGVEGLRQAKLSYHPSSLLHKYTVMTKHPFSADCEPVASADVQN